jgi:hypothetical protein
MIEKGHSGQNRKEAAAHVFKHPHAQVFDIHTCLLVKAIDGSAQ